MPRPMYRSRFTSPKQSILPSLAKVDTFPALAQALPAIFSRLGRTGKCFSNRRGQDTTRKVDSEGQEVSGVGPGEAGRVTQPRCLCSRLLALVP